MDSNASPEQQHEWLDGWLRACGHRVAAERASRKAALAAEGVNARGLRLYMDYGDRLFVPLVADWLDANQPRQSARRALAYLRLLQSCEMDIAPPRLLPRAFIRAGFQELDAGQAQLFRSAWRAMSQAEYCGMPQDRWMTRECVPVLVWMLAKKNGKEATSKRMSGAMNWTSLLRQCREDTRERKLPAWRMDWSGLMGYQSVRPGYLWVPLCSTAALEDEGDVMKHCVADYAEVCRLGLYSVFSLRSLPGRERVATLGLEQADTGEWYIDQFKGPRNATPDAVLQQLATDFLGRVQRGMRYPDDAIEDAQWREVARQQAADPLLLKDCRVKSK